MKFLAILIVCAFFLNAVIAQSNNCKGNINNNPVYTGDPVLVKQTHNGKLYYLRNAVQPNVPILHVFGTPYQMGYAAGELVGDQMKAMLSKVYAYLDSQIAPYLKDLPQFLQEIIEEYGVAGALEVTYYLTQPYTPDHFYQELKGISDAAKIDYMELVRINMLPELIQAACSMYGAWGAAIKNTTGTLYQLRALDWDMDGPFQEYPLVTVYHPSAEGSFSFATVGYSGLVGAITGISSSPVGICEKVWISYKGSKPRSGYPWPFLLRDILQFDADISSAQNRIINAERTCSIWVGLGDGHINQFRATAYSHDYVEFYDDHNYPAYANHPLMDGLVWIDKHVQPSGDPCMTALLKQFYGNITPENTIQYITSQFQTGDSHIGIYDYKNMYLYVSYAAPVSAGDTPAYDRQFSRIDLKKVFSEQPPQL